MNGKKHRDATIKLGESFDRAMGIDG